PDGVGGIAADDLEFVEINNPTNAAVTLTDWRIRKGVDYDFAAGSSIAAGQSIVVLSFNPDDPANGSRVNAFLTHYGLSKNAPLLGGYLGKLDDDGEKVQLQRPDAPPPEEPNLIPRLIEDEVVYGDEAPWTTEPDGGGQSLNRNGTGLWGNAATSWVAAAPSPGTYNQPPTAVALANSITSLPENIDTSGRIKLADIQVTDDAVGTNQISLTGGDPDSFQVDGNELYLRAGQLLDFESQDSYTITVSVEDSTLAGSTPVTVDYALSVTDANDAPTAVALTNTVNALAENTDTGGRIKLADIQVTDDGAGTNQISLAGADAASFEIEAAQLYLKAGQVLDFESQASYEVTVSAEDSTVFGSTPATADLALGITDVNEAPTAAALANAINAVAENTDTADRIKLADIQVADDALGTNEISLAGTAAASFEVDGNELYLRAGQTLDFESQHSYDVTVSIEDSTLAGGTPVTVDLALGITDVNEPPTDVVLANAVTTLVESTDTSSRIKLADIQVADDALGTNEITLAGGDAASFEVDGNELYLQAGQILDFESQVSYTIIVSVQDNTLAGSPPVTADFTLAVTDDNMEPVTLSGTKFDDLNANGQRDSDDPSSRLFEPGLAGWTIRLYLDDGNGLLEPNAD
ncbi:MAG: lamin tail domain-containing protein, partial [Pirellulales bacterium]